MRIAFAFEGSIPSPQADAEVFLNTAAALARRGHAVSYPKPFSTTTVSMAPCASCRYEIPSDSGPHNMAYRRSVCP
jgi:hypothetical protein